MGFVEEELPPDHAHDRRVCAFDTLGNAVGIGQPRAGEDLRRERRAGLDDGLFGFFFFHAGEQYVGVLLEGKEYGFFQGDGALSGLGGR
jgi:hypothetical protein